VSAGAASPEVGEPSGSDDAEASGFEPRRPALLTLRVAELERSLAFYHGVLGIPLKLRAGRSAELQAETIVLALVEDTTVTTAQVPRSQALGWEVRDLDAARRVLAASGIACEDVGLPAGADEALFGRRARFRDPDGHVLELACWRP
jgi:catechol 2,3-dioxygenase-like lactoylglutathione lyase family enzyme